MSDKSFERLLLVDRNPEDVRLLREMLDRPGSRRIETAHVDSMAAAETHLRAHATDIVLLDLGLPDAPGLAAVRRTRAAAPRATLIVLAGPEGEPAAVKALREGADDYLVKGHLDGRGLWRALRYAAERKVCDDRYRSVLEHAKDAILLVRPDLEIVEANRRAAELLGCPREAIIGRSYVSFTVPEDRSLIAADQARLFAEGSTRIEDRRLLRTDGSVVSVDVFASVIPNGDETVVLAILHDTSERKRAERELGTARGRLQHLVSENVSERRSAEQRLQESEAQYRLLFDSNPHPMWVFDAETLAFLAVNDAAVRLYGFSRDEFLGMTIKEIRPQEEVAALSAYVATMPDSPSLPAIHVKHRKRDGSLLEVAGASNPIQFHGRRARLVLAHDVSEKRLLEAQLLQAQKMEAVGRLAGGVAHDFNNLLGVITGYGELLLEDLGPEHRGSKRVEQILGAATRAAGLTRQLLAFSRKQVLQPRVLDLDAIVADVEKMVRRLIGENIQIEMTRGDGLGGIRADPGQIEQVLMNLVVNARDAMPRGGKLTIETANITLDEAYARAHPEVTPGPYVALTVSDNGVGMDAETRAHIFEPFFTTKEEGKGTGLGLATVFGIVQQSGGSVTVSSRLGEGTTFTIHFPRVAGELPPPSPAAPDAPLSRGGETLLLVEDADALRVMIREILESADYTVVEFSDPEEALLSVTSGSAPVALMLTDVVMPRMSGPDLARSVRIQRPEMKVLFMSGYTDEAMGLHGVLAEGMQFIQKPFTADALLQKVREALDVTKAGAPALAAPVPGGEVEA